MKDLLSELGLANVDQEKPTKYVENKVHIAQRCLICGQIFAKKHPKSDETICQKCREKI